MLDIIPMLVGIIIMIKGQFQLPGRYITKATGRTIGLLLIAPSAISFCAGGHSGRGGGDEQRRNHAGRADHH